MRRVIVLFGGQGEVVSIRTSANRTTERFGKEELKFRARQQDEP